MYGGDVQRAKKGVVHLLGSVMPGAVNRERNFNPAARHILQVGENHASLSPAGNS